MKIEQIYTGCLSQGAYYIESDGEAAVIDPLREATPYIQKAGKTNANIKYIFETHFHADFVSGHLDLQRDTGATIVYGPGAQTSFAAYVAKDGEHFQVGKLTVQLLHTPGHTLESSCFLLHDEYSKPIALFTGDTLFIGDVGRPDLAQEASEGITQEFLASLLYNSLREKILPLADDIIIYPGHGAGSACGKNMSKETFDTLGHQKQTNYALRQGMIKKDFIDEVTSGLKEPPAYFPINVQMNRSGYDHLNSVLSKGTKALSLQQFETEAMKEDAILLDTRSPKSFAQGFIPGSINIGLEGSFAPWVGALIPFERKRLLLIADLTKENEVITRLARIGFDHAVGFLQGGFKTWLDAGSQIDQVSRISAFEFADNYELLSENIIDVRKESEYRLGHLPNAINIPLDDVYERFNEIDKTKDYLVHCAGGYRSMIFISILKEKGYKNLIDIEGGYNAIQNTGIINY